MASSLPNPRIPGRGPNIHAPNRFEPILIEPDEDYLEIADPEAPPSERPHPRTQFFFDATESILVHYRSPDLGPGWNLNPYRGCEHGCAYCYARPYHDYLGWSGGIDFETKILVKLRAPALLRTELTSGKWEPRPVTISGITDCYQPCERHFRLTRGCLQVFAELRHPVAIITKNFLITRDLDIIAELARFHCIAVTITVTTLDAELAGRLEPRAARPTHRLRAIRELAAIGVPVNVNLAPVIPGLTEHEIPSLLEAVAAAGATRANFITLRLPFTVKDVFLQWLETHEPGKKERVLSRLRQLHGGKLYDADFGARLTGQGIFAEQIRQLFEVACRRLGLNRDTRPLTTEHFRRPGGRQLELF